MTNTYTDCSHGPEEEERLVLSEVHLASGASNQEPEVVSRYSYLTPSLDNIDTDSSSDSDSDGGENSDSDGSVAKHRGKKRPRAESSPRPATSQRSSRPRHEILTVVHRMATKLSLVGQQVWSAAFLLGDLVLTHEELFTGVQVLELGSGPGVPGLVAARVARKAFLTDYHDEVLKLLARNAEANLHLFADDAPPIDGSNNNTAVVVGRGSPTKGDSSGGGETDSTVDCGEKACREGNQKEVGSSPGVVAVRKLDWFAFSPREGPTDAAICSSSAEGHQEAQAGAVEDGRIPDVSRNEEEGECPFAWKKGELEQLVGPPATRDDGVVILASDVIYDEGLTEAFFDVLKMLMPVPQAVPTESNHVGTFTVTSPDELYVGNSELEKTSRGSVCVEPQTIHDKEGCDSRRSEAVLYLALEKRFNFSLAELSVAATGYNALLRNVVDITEGGDGSSTSSSVGKQKLFEGKRLPLTFPQCFRYQRSNAMEIWEIRRRRIV